MQHYSFSLFFLSVSFPPSPPLLLLDAASSYFSDLFPYSFSLLPPHLIFSYLFSRVHPTLQSALSIGRSVGWLVGWSVTLYFFYDFISLTSLLLPKWSGDLKYGPCPSARDFSSRVSGLVLLTGENCALTN